MWVALQLIGVLAVFYLGAVLIAGFIARGPEVEMPGGETIFPPPEPDPDPLRPKYD